MNKFTVQWIENSINIDRFKPRKLDKIKSNFSYFPLRGNDQSKYKLLGNSLKGISNISNLVWTYQLNGPNLYPIQTSFIIFQNVNQETILHKFTKTVILYDSTIQKQSYDMITKRQLWTPRYMDTEVHEISIALGSAFALRLITQDKMWTVMNSTPTMKFNFFYLST